MSGPSTTVNHDMRSEIARRAAVGINLLASAMVKELRTSEEVAASEIAHRISQLSALILSSHDELETYESLSGHWLETYGAEGWQDVLDASTQGGVR